MKIKKLFYSIMIAPFLFACNKIPYFEEFNEIKETRSLDSITPVVTETFIYKEQSSIYLSSNIDFGVLTKKNIQENLTFFSKDELYEKYKQKFEKKFNKLFTDDYQESHIFAWLGITYTCGGVGKMLDSIIVKQNTNIILNIGTPYEAISQSPCATYVDYMFYLFAIPKTWFLNFKNIDKSSILINEIESKDYWNYRQKYPLGNIFFQEK